MKYKRFTVLALAAAVVPAGVALMAVADTDPCPEASTTIASSLLEGSKCTSWRGQTVEAGSLSAPVPDPGTAVGVVSTVSSEGSAEPESLTLLRDESGRLAAVLTDGTVHGHVDEAFFEKMMHGHS